MLKGYVNKFLSWKPLLPLARLSYGTYLVHFLMHQVLIFSTRTTIFCNAFTPVSLQIFTVNGSSYFLSNYSLRTTSQSVQVGIWFSIELTLGCVWLRIAIRLAHYQLHLKDFCWNWNGTLVTRLSYGSVWFSFSHGVPATHTAGSLGKTFPSWSCVIQLL